MAKLCANSEDPDQTPRSSASALFANYSFRGLPTTMGRETDTLSGFRRNNSVKSVFVPFQKRIYSVMKEFPPTLEKPAGGHHENIPI